jgi:hypothetical protein
MIKIETDRTDISKFRNVFIKISQHITFEYFIIVCIVLNTVVLATHWY